MKIKETEAAIEAILFAMGGSVELPRIARAIGVDEKTTGRIIRNMMDRYQEENRGIQIIELENSFQMCTKKEMYDYLIRVAKQPKKYTLTDVLLETMSGKGSEVGRNFQELRQIIDQVELKEKLGLTYVFITHDLTSITYLCDDVLFLYQGHVTEYLPVSRISEAKDEYARRLLESIVVFDMEERKDAV